MATIKIKGNTVNTSGNLPEVGQKAPDFLLTKTDLSDVSLKDLAGKNVVMNIFPSVDTSVCSASVRKFNEMASKFPDTVVLCASLDLPFAHSRFCETEGLKDVVPVSELRNRQFGEAYGVRITQGPLTGLLARAVIILDKKGVVRYSKLVEELTNEPNYLEALDALKHIGEEGGENMEVCTQSNTAEHSRSMNADEPCKDGRSR